MKENPDYVLDFRQTIISFALLKMKQVLGEMKANEVLEIITRDPDARSDVFKVIPGAMCELVDMQFDNDADCCRIRLRKRRQSR